MEDRVRMDAYQKAIQQLAPGKIVCEIGLGMAPLSLMALKAGAAKVYGIECHRATFEMAQGIMRDQGFQPSRYRLYHGLSTEVSLPERVDLLLSETLDHLGIGENTVAFVKDAQRRFLKPEGRCIPDLLTCYVALARPEAFEDEVGFWTGTLLSEYGLDYRKVGNFMRKQRHVLSVKAEEIASTWWRWQEIRFEDPHSFRQRSTALLVADRDEEVTGTCFAFNARLSEGVEICTLPGKPQTHWKQAFVPFAAPMTVRRGDLFHLELLTIQSRDHLSITLGRGMRHIPCRLAKTYLAEHFRPSTPALEPSVPVLA